MVNLSRLRPVAVLLLLSCFLPPVGAQTPMLAAPIERSWEKQQQWEEMFDLEGRFKVLTPALLEYATDTLETAIGQQVYHTYFLEVPDATQSDNVIYALSYVDYPDGSLHQDSTELVTELFDSSEEAAAENVGGELVYSNPTEVSGFPARQWRIDYNGGKATARSIAVVAHNRYYEVRTFSLRKRGANQSNNKFFESLVLFGKDTPKGE